MSTTQTHQENVKSCIHLLLPIICQCVTEKKIQIDKMEVHCDW